MANSLLHARSTLLALSLAMFLAGCVTARIDGPREPSRAWPYPTETPLGRMFLHSIGQGNAAIHLLPSGVEAFGLRAALADNAERTLDLQYYIVRDDATSHLLLHRVLAAADRGVRVRILIDDVYAAGNERHLVQFAAHPKVEMRVYNPFRYRGPLALVRMFDFATDALRLNRRMHNKLWIADNAAAIIGGRNLGDEYFDAHSDRNFSDLDVFAAGPIVRDLSRSFDEFWNSEWSIPIQAFIAIEQGPDQLDERRHDLRELREARRDLAYADASDLRVDSISLDPAHAAVIYDDPGKVQGRTARELPAAAVVSSVLPMIVKAEREVILISPYFIPSEPAVDILSRLSARGVRVRILTNSLASTDVPLAHAAYARFRNRLLSAGVELHETRPEQLVHTRRHRGPSSGASLHAKAVVVDRRYSLLGSMNFDPRSRIHNTEIALLLESEHIGAEVAEFFEEAVSPAHAFRLLAGDAARIVWITEDAGTELRYERDPVAGWWRRFVANVLSVFAPDHLL